MVVHAGATQPTLRQVTDHVFSTQALDLPTFASLQTQRTVDEMGRLDWGD